VPVITSRLQPLIIAIAAAGCGSSTRGAADASSDATPFCAEALGADCAASSSLAGYCSLTMGIDTACGPCRSPDAGAGCAVVLGQGTNYSYLQILGLDTAEVYVYDANRALVARLDWSPGGFRCRVGPANFDPGEADSLIQAAYAPGLNNGMCPVDGGTAS